jgi:hypothetical protein
MRGIQVGIPIARAAWLKCRGKVVALLWIALCAVVTLGGCSVFEVARSEPGADLSSVRTGATREQVEAALGQPVREWTTTQGVRYCMYKYYGGKQADGAGIGATVFMNIATLGLWEAFVQGDPSMKQSMSDAGKQYPLLAVSYDARNMVLGVFSGVDEFTALPPDGRAPPPATATDRQTAG